MKASILKDKRKAKNLDEFFRSSRLSISNKPSTSGETYLVEDVYESSKVLIVSRSTDEIE